MTMLKTFDLNGNKQSFANWISNLSPCETPFISMIPKESVDEVQYSWQTDALSKAALPAEVQEGSGATATKPKATTVVTNFTKIFRKAVRVSDTTKKVALYGRASELAYQMEKAGMEIKRDVEHYVLHTDDDGEIGSANKASKAAGIQKLVAQSGFADSDTGAVVHKTVKHNSGAKAQFTKADIFDITYNLYLVGSRANKVMVHPMHVHIFSDMIGDLNPAGVATKTPHLHRMFDGLDTKYNAFVKRFRDPLGQEFEVIPNRYMPKNSVLFFNEADWTQMILRAPEKTELGRTGSTDKFMIEMEVGLRHRNPFASGMMTLEQNTVVVAEKTRKAAK